MTRWLPRAGLDELIQLLACDGYEVVGPTIDQAAIVYGRIESVADLPEGWTDRQGPGEYRLEQRGDHQLFGYVVGPHSWKKYLFPADELVAAAQRAGDSWHFTTPTAAPQRYAFLGVRACELAAIAVQDRVFLGGPYVDPLYRARREAVLLIAVNCTQAAATCFCRSMNTGPRCAAGFDLALTELEQGFTVECGTDRGRELLQRLGVSGEAALASPDQLEAAESARSRAVAQMTRQMNTDGLRELLLGNLESPRWDAIAERCLSCTNCTMVCPTCFCSTVTEVADLTQVDRRRQWDSCFNIDFSRVNGNPSRNSIAGRYRQWLTHKLGTWQDQFGTSGCVGCGRCITWCPPGIDLTEEVVELRAAADSAKANA
ncbi:MAG: 4Fe-4S dicluster domain-containing protein [Planctomycetota bacterium]